MNPDIKSTTSVYHLFEEIDIKLPFWRYFEVFRNATHAFFLDSSLADKKLGEFSFMGANPFLIYKAYIEEEKLNEKSRKKNRVRVEQQTRNTGSAGSTIESYHCEDLFADFRSTMDAFKFSESPYLAKGIPFLAGAVGYWGYEIGTLIEEIPGDLEDDLSLPDAYFMFVDETLCHSHASGKTHISILARGGTVEEAKVQAFKQKEALLSRIKRFEAGSNGASAMGSSSVDFKQIAAQHDRHSYGLAIDSILDAIREGAAYEVCLTHQYSCEQTQDAWALYKSLRQINPAPFSSYLQLPEVQVVSSSPERFLRLDKNRVIESRPIKGTRRRGENEVEDEALAVDLQSANKDRAENLMIVDLVRNDLGRVAEMGSVHVPDLLHIERYATVFQMVSTIRGVLKEGLDALDLVKACFPGGSMTGAPKIAAMKIIKHLEKTRRGIYSGSIGYIDFCGTMDLNIVIRTIIVRNGRCYFNVGGAVVSDSDPNEEYQETLDKARALVAALRT